VNNIAQKLLDRLPALPGKPATFIGKVLRR